MLRRIAGILDRDSGVFSQDWTSIFPPIVATLANPTTHGLRLLQEEK